MAGWGWLTKRERSAVSLELAIAAIPFFTLFLGAMEVAYDLYVQGAMDLMVETLGTDIWTGKIQGAMSSPSFVSNYVCPRFGGLLDCNLVTVSIGPVPSDFWHNVETPYVIGNSLSTATWTVVTGCPGTHSLFRAVYAGPTFVGGLIPSFAVSSGGGLVHATYAAAGFVSETFTTATGC